MIKKLISFGVVILALFIYKIHHPVPDDCDDYLASQIFTDIIHATGLIGELFQKVGLQRWIPFYFFAKIQLLLPQNISRDVKIQYTRFADVPSIVVTPKIKTDEKLPTIVYYHGGGWTIGSIESYKKILAQMAIHTNSIVMSPDYRLSPEYPFPTPYEDCLKSTVAFLSSCEKDYNCDVNKAVLAGDSAGGNLAMSITNSLLKNNELSITSPVMQVLIYPSVQMVNFDLDSFKMRGVDGNPLMPTWLLYSFLMSYWGLETESHLRDLLDENRHVDVTNKDIADKLKWVKNHYLEKNANKAMKPVKTESEEIKLFQSKVSKLVLDPRMCPLMETDINLSKLPRTHVLVCGYDQLKDDGFIVVEKLRSLGVNTTLQYLPRSLHGSLNIGSDLESDSSYYWQQNLLLFKYIKNYISQL